MPGRLISKEYLAVPVALTGPSMRSTRLPSSARFSAAGHSTFAMRHLLYRLFPAGLFYQTWSPFLWWHRADCWIANSLRWFSTPVSCKNWLIRISFKTLSLKLQAFFQTKIRWPKSGLSPADLPVKIGIMKRRHLVSRGSLPRIFEAATEAWRQQNYPETIALLERASRLDPANPRICFDLGRAYGLRYDYSAAERCLEKAVRLVSPKADALAEAGRRCQEFGQYEMATHYFERASDERGVSADVLVTLAELYERGPRAGEAAALIERALTI